MKAKISIITSLFLFMILSGCNINYSESGKKLNFEEDSKDLSLAKKSLKYINESKTDSLKKMFDEDALQNYRSEELEWLFTNGKRIIDNNEYPNDSIITVSTTTRKAISGEETFKEFNFPFINKNSPDSTMYFKISIANDKILYLILSTGMRIIE